MGNIESNKKFKRSIEPQHLINPNSVNKNEKKPFGLDRKSIKDHKSKN